MKVAIRFGIEAWMDGPSCEDNQLTVQPGDRVLVRKQREHWMLGKVIPPRKESSAASEPQHQFHGREGWFPSACIKQGSEAMNQVPKQKMLGGMWESEAGRTIRVSGVLVYVWVAPEDEAPPFILKEGWDSTGKFTTLQGCRLLHIDLKVARWSNGDAWHRKEDKTKLVKKRAEDPCVDSDSPSDGDDSDEGCDDEEEKKPSLRARHTVPMQNMKLPEDDEDDGVKKNR